MSFAFKFHNSCSPGVNWLRDPRSRVYNYNPGLEEIPNIRDFAFERLPGFVTSSHDQVRNPLNFYTPNDFAAYLSLPLGFIVSRKAGRTHVRRLNIVAERSTLSNIFSSFQRPPGGYITPKCSIFETSEQAMMTPSLIFPDRQYSVSAQEIYAWTAHACCCCL